MFVIKRNGTEQPVSFDKIIQRLQPQAHGLDSCIDPVEIAQRVINGLYSGISTSELDTLAAETAVAKISLHPDFGVLATRIYVTNLHRNTSDCFSTLVTAMSRYINPETSAYAPLVSKSFCDRVNRLGADALDAAIQYSRDMSYDMFGLKTLERSYLLRMNGKVCERPQHMLMRVALTVTPSNYDGSVDTETELRAVIQTYNALSLRVYTHATPTLFNAGTPRPQLSSCFLLAIADDSIEGIFKTIADCARISKFAGGIGMSISNVRAFGSYIRGTGGYSNGLVPMLRVLNNVARYIDQGGGKRKGSFAVYLEPWHADVREVLELKKNHGHEADRARDLFYAMWIPDLFMRRVRDGKQWTLFCPNSAPGLCDVHSTAFDTLYEKYELEGVGKTTVDARTLFQQMVKSQIETGVPYMLYKDACNRKSNQQHLGTIKCSNLCTEIIQYTSPTETSVCNLASLNLPVFVLPLPEQEQEPGPVPNVIDMYDYTGLAAAAYDVCIKLNHVIDVSYYPTEEAKRSNLLHRPIGIGVQGLADVFCIMHVSFDSPEARIINKRIFESIYLGAVQASIGMARQCGAYESFPGSPASNGQLQFHMWGLTQADLVHDWSWVLNSLPLYGMRNSLLVAPMPTASTSQILGNNECFEPYTSNLFTRRTLSGEFTVVNKHLVRRLLKLGLWNKELRNLIIAADGSVQSIECIPEDIKKVYRTVWEIPMKSLIDMAAERAPFICQSQSLNLFMDTPTINKVSSMHFYAWQKGLKTGMYYLRTKAKAAAVQFTVDPVIERPVSFKIKTDVEDAVCESCSA